MRRPPRIRYFLPLALALLAAACLPASGTARPTGGAAGCEPDADWGAPRPELAAQVVELVNRHRASAGLSALQVSPTLSAAAIWKARHMARYGYMAHDDPGPPVSRSTGERIAACGYAGGGWGENIAYGFPNASSVMQGWLTSPGHRSNIERASFRTIGVGAAAAKNGLIFWAQAFGTVADSGSSAPARTTPAAAPKSSTRPNVRPTRRELGTTRVLRRSAPRAGHKFTAQVRVEVRGNGTPVTAGLVVCRARVGKRAIWLGVHRFKDGRATCTWRAPRWARGRHIVGTIGIRTAEGKRGVRNFTRSIR
ncbi:MAG: CAP domain-containing protein [Gaiellaceae bacterium]